MVENVTVVILTFNEEGIIETSIKSALQCTSHVLVVDSGSTDNTVSIAKRLGAQVIYRKWDNDFSAQRNFALQHVSTEWVFYLDADECINKELADEIKRVTQPKETHRAYEIKRISIVFGKRCYYGSFRPDYVLRVFPCKYVTWVNKVHEHPVTQLAKQPLKGYADHYTYTSWEQYWTKFNQYTSIWAVDAFNKGKKSSLVKAFFHSVLGFIKIGILNRGLLDGKYGFIFSYNHSVYTFVKYIKLMELNNRERRYTDADNESC